MILKIDTNSIKNSRFCKGCRYLRDYNTLRWCNIFEIYLEKEFNEHSFCGRDVVRCDECLSSEIKE